MAAISNPTSKSCEVVGSSCVGSCTGMGGHGKAAAYMANCSMSAGGIMAYSVDSVYDSSYSVLPPPPHIFPFFSRGSVGLAMHEDVCPHDDACLCPPAAVIEFNAYIEATQLQPLFIYSHLGLVATHHLLLNSKGFLLGRHFLQSTDWVNLYRHAHTQYVVQFGIFHDFHHSTLGFIMCNLGMHHVYRVQRWWRKVSHERAQKKIAFLMASHARVGAQSCAAVLQPELLRLCCSFF